MAPHKFFLATAHGSMDNSGSCFCNDSGSMRHKILVLQAALIPVRGECYDLYPLCVRRGSNSCLMDEKLLARVGVDLYAVAYSSY